VWHVSRAYLILWVAKLEAGLVLVSSDTADVEES
jgi:hypothetical protein